MNGSVQCLCSLSVMLYVVMPYERSFLHIGRFNSSQYDVHHAVDKRKSFVGQ